jgi:hypothetical protein
VGGKGARIAGAPKSAWMPLIAGTRNSTRKVVTIRPNPSLIDHLAGDQRPQDDVAAGDQVAIELQVRAMVGEAHGLGAHGPHPLDREARPDRGSGRAEVPAPGAKRRAARSAPGF